MVQQWSVVVVVEGDINPFDITSDYLEALRVQGDYDIVATSISPVSGVCKTSGNNDNHIATDHHDNRAGDDYHNDDACFCGRTHATAAFGDILDGRDPAVYAGISVGRGVR